MPSAPTRCLVPSCGATSSNQWGVSPDGPRTLCCRCYSRYYQNRLPLYQDRDTKALSVIPTENSRPMLILGFPPGKHGRDLSRPIVRPMTPSEIEVAQATAPSWRGGSAQPSTPSYPSSGHPSTADSRVMCAEIADGNGERIWCVADECPGSTNRQRADGPDGLRTACGDCYAKYTFNRVRVFRKNNRLSLFPRHGWTVFKGEANEGVGGAWWKLEGKRVVCWCVRCGAPGAGWCGPDGVGSLCRDCWDLFKEGGMVMALKSSGQASLVSSVGGRRCLVKAWRGVERGRVDYRNPLVEEYDGALQVGEVMELEEEQPEHGTEREGVWKVEYEDEEGLEMEEVCFEEKQEMEDVVGKLENEGVPGNGELSDLVRKEERQDVARKQKIEMLPGDLVDGEETFVVGADDVVVQEAEMTADDEEDGVSLGAEGALADDEMEGVNHLIEEKLDVEVEWQGLRRAGLIRVGLSFSGFCSAVRRLAHVQDRDVEVKYCDDEGDFVTVATEGDLMEMVHLVRHMQISPVVLRIERSKPAQRLRVIPML
eukprot:GFKZ01003725.1.p1 GENE.GFKZ01003725.1~~GFKZ01003725.1.p1  ORF type:complete len:540 (-),score=81.53 GFKZ01003725.1:2148-3767(-)